MSLDQYRLLAQLEAGPDGASYRAERRADLAAVEVRLLGGVRANPQRWDVLGKRLRLALLLDHADALRLHEKDLEHDPPYLVLEWLEAKTLAEQFRDRLPLPQSDALALVHGLAGVISAAHRLNLAHGCLAPSRIKCANDRSLKVDFSRLSTGRQDSGSADLETKFRDPGCRDPLHFALPMDTYSMGALLFWLLTGQTPSAVPDVGTDLRALRPTAPGIPPINGSDPDALYRLFAAVLAREPADRPSAWELQKRLAALLAPAVATGEFKASDERLTVASDVGSSAAPALDNDLGLQQLGRFRLLDKLGTGGMGAVYRAEDSCDGNQVAIKVLRGDWAKRDIALRRFNKEARLLAEVNNPYVANLLEVNEDGGIHYLVLEYVDGQSLGQVLNERGSLDEATAVAVMADVARALLEAHERGIVHRDIKPDNILLVRDGLGTDGGQVNKGSAQDRQSLPTLEQLPFPSRDAPPKVKLTDFGLARHVVESESLHFTQTGAILGTPYYMAPEQCTGKDTIAPPTDIYAMGATLFHLLAGRPPFIGDNQLGVIAMHCNDPPPALRTLNPAISEATAQVVDKCLAKAPEARYANAGALLRDLERVSRGEPTSILAHPRLPEGDATKILQYDWSWDLQAAPEQLWPHVSNTERLNRACGLPPVQFSVQADAGGVRRHGKFRKAGVTALWQEHPFEWVEARRFGVLREYSQGPFKWIVSMVELAARAGGGTRLTHRVRIEPKGMIGRTVAAVEVGVKGRRAVDRVYRRIDAAVTNKLGDPGLADPFEEPTSLAGPRRRRLDLLLQKLNGRGVDPAVVERFGDFLAMAPAQEVARIRPLSLARRLALDPEQLVAACMHGVHEGLLLLLWDILCPVCRIPSEVKETLKVLREHGRCEACNLDFTLDFANSVEMIFRAHPEIRETELGVYCIGGPAHSPHVIAQVRVAPSERIELELALPEGAYRLRGPQLPFVLDFRVQPGASPRHWELNLSRGPDPALPRTLQAGRQMIALSNDHPQELVVRIERTAPRADALTAARASTSALFRQLFPAEVLSPGQLVSIANVTLLFTNLEGAGKLYEERGDVKAFALIHEHFRVLDNCIRGEGGALVKTVGEGLFAAFVEPLSAVRAGLAMIEALARHAATQGLGLRLGIHRGAAMAATLNDHLDYFGSTVNLAAGLPSHGRAGEMILSQVVAAEPEVLALLQTRHWLCEPIDTTAADATGGIMHRVRNSNKAIAG